ncbi:MAG: 16S rRNA (cytosine(1402)-N(4))-methyltransferase RsmH [Selenomonadales bacterium]|nr:16S rRNA (cytosine(1402)-N(4))-methyltransferase RsmH [Selenomonadales bacterium]
MEHVPVLLQESLVALNLKPGDKVLDCTFGRGGHTREFLKAVGPNGLVIGLDVDREAEVAAEAFKGEPAFRFVRRDFRQLDSALALTDVRYVDAVFFDLGVSSPQLDERGRGFSYQHDARLDMRMDERQKLSAIDIVNTYAETKLAEILHEYGEERWSKRIAAFIVEARARQPIETTQQLVSVIKAAIPKGVRDKEEQHPARRTFQALRIAVNDELGALEEALTKAVKALVAGGRLGCISFHSLEDRVVKQFMVSAAKDCVCPSGVPQCVCQVKPVLRLLTRKAIAPSAEEIRVNPRSRSARLRAAERL